MALTICEDAWNDKRFWNRRLYGIDPVEELVRAGGTLCSTYPHRRFAGQARVAPGDAYLHRAESESPVAMVNQVGGNDSLVFDGSSMSLRRRASDRAREAFEEDLVYFDSQKLIGDMHPDGGRRSERV